MAGYGTDIEFQEWLDSNGYVLPEDAPTLAVLRQRGSTYIDALYGRCFFGCPTGGVEQERSWPRTGAVVHCMTIPSNLIPMAVVEASYIAAWMEASNPGSLSSIIDQSREIKREKVDVLEREYFQSSSGEDGYVGISPLNSLIDGILGPYVDQVCMGREELGGDTLGIWAIGKSCRC